MSCLSIVTTDPGTDDVDEFEKNTENTMLSTFEMTDPIPLINASDSWQGNYVYYGKNNGTPTKYRVLDHSTVDFNAENNSEPTMLLFSKDGLFRCEFDEENSTNAWSKSDIKYTLNSQFLMSSFSIIEKASIAESYKAEKNSSVDGTDYEQYGFAPLTGEKLFILDAAEALSTSYGFMDFREGCRSRRMLNVNNNQATWWLRSSGYVTANNDYEGVYVNPDGIIAYNIVYADSYIRPAFNVKLSDILFATAVDREQVDLYSTDYNTGYKLTLTTDAITTSLDTGGRVVIKDRNVTVPYKIGGTYVNKINRLSVLILDKEYTAGNSNGANIKYYGGLNVDGEIGTTGTGSFILPASLDPEKWGSDYKVYIFSEWQNGQFETDYASVPLEIIPQKEKYNVWVNNTQFDEDNLQIACGDGYASFDPETNTLTFEDATITDFSNTYVHLTKAAVEAKGIPLTIKGTLTIDGANESLGGKMYSAGIVIVDSAQGVDIDAQITIKNLKKGYGICSISSDITIAGGMIDIDAANGAFAVDGNINLADGVDVISPASAQFRKVNDYTRLLESETSDVEVKKAKIGRPQYTINFDLNDHGEEIESVKVTKGNKVEEPVAPEEEGWIFGGWFTDEECTTAYDFTKEVTSDLTLYAKWTSGGFTVTFDMGGKATNVTASVENGQPVSRPATDPEVEGYVFTGWFEEEDCATEYDFKRVITKNTRIFAGWREAAKFKVVFSANKVEAKNMPTDKTVEEGKIVTKPAADPIADGYTFTGWYADTDCTTTYTFTEPVKENTIIYAGWKEDNDPSKELTVSFNMMGRGTAIPAQTVSENGKVEQPDNPAEEGWVFGGWFKDKELTEIYDFDTPVTADMILYAKWDDKAKVTVFTVTFNMMDHGTTIKPVEVVSGNVLSKPKMPVEEGWKFEGWFKEEGCVNEYNFKDPVKESFTLYAKWTEQKESVSKGISALDNRPVINETTTDIYLVKGQKFFIGKEWSVADRVAKQYVNINKKGYLMAKKPDPESVTVKIKKEGRADITVHICQPALSDKKKTLIIDDADKKTDFTLSISKDDGIKNVLWYSAAPDVATVDQTGKVTAVAQGKAKITAYVNGKAYNCNITVKESVAAKNRTMHVNLDGSKSIKVKGVRNWIVADESIAERVNNADKFKAMKVGKTVLSASENDIKYTIDFYVEDITINGEKVSGGNKNKYTIDNLQVGTATDIALPGVKQDVVFKSSKPDVAFVDEKGHIVARSKGTAKLTTKINGKTITILVVVNE